ncbi:hypothetical protein P6B95_05545 [Streptomyces atratus]|nr:hypothetical protein [Streptomyces atratus]WPW26917.1 hypothetical protein P6B95_05545 [Streptomyces atratus]
MAGVDPPTVRKRAWDWWQVVLQTCLEADGAICVIQTCRHEGDLSGCILAEANEWHVIELPAVAELATDILGGQLGEPLPPGLCNAYSDAPPDQGATCRLVGARAASARSAFVRFVPLLVGNVRSACARFAFPSSARLRSASERFAPISLAAEVPPL